jgi:acyl-[acyl carrier protein]--UDP-N-acetylglucosamine O-acyltransferase
MYVASDVSLNGGLFLSGDASLNSNLKVGSRMYVANDVSLNGGLFLSGDASLNSNLRIGNSVSVYGNVNSVGGFSENGVFLNATYAKLSGSTFVNDVIINGNLNATTLFENGYPVSINRDVIQIASSTANATYSFSQINAGDIYFISSGSALNYYGNVVLPSSNNEQIYTYLINAQTVGSRAFNLKTTTGTFEPWGVSTFVLQPGSNALLKGRTDGGWHLIGGNYDSARLTAYNNTFTGITTFLADTSMNSNLKVGSRMYVASDVSLNGGLFLSGDASLNSNLRIGSRMYVANDVSLNGRLFLSGDASFNGNLFMSGNLYTTDSGEGWLGYSGNSRLSNNNTETQLGANTNLRFYTGTTSATMGNEKITLLLNGNVGIGTSTPAYVFDVVGASRFQTAPIMSGANITAASIPDSALSANIPELNAAQTFTALQTISMGSATDGLRVTKFGTNGSSYIVLNNGLIGTWNGAQINWQIDFSGNLTTSGNVGIGTSVGTVPSYKLDVNGASRFQTAPIMSGANITAATIPDSALSANIPELNAAQTFTGINTFSLDTSFNSNLKVGSRMYVASDVSLNGRLFLSGDASFNGNLFMSGNLYTTDSGEGWLGYSGNSRLSNNNTETQLGANTNLRFYTGTTSATMGTERMTLLQNGNVGIGNATPAYTLDITGNLRATGTATAASFNATSDRRLKTNIEPLSSQWNNIKFLQPAQYKWIYTSKPDHGFIAQDVYTLYPDMRTQFETVDTSSNIEFPTDYSGNPLYYTLDYSKMTPYLWKGLQEAIQTIEKQQSQIDDLIKKVSLLTEIVSGTP